MSRVEHFDTGATEHHNLPVSKIKEYADPVFQPWEKFHRQEAGYIGNLASNIRQHGVQEPLVIRSGVLHDGHHRLAAAEKLGLTHLPVRFERKLDTEGVSEHGVPSLPTDPHPPWRERLKS